MIRPFRPDDADPVAALLHRDELPHGVTGPGIHHWLRAQPERARAAMWVAEAGGEIAGWARARLRWATTAEGVAETWGFVAPRRRRRGLGGDLYDAAHAYLRDAGARVLESWTTGPAGDRFLRGRGFEPTRTQVLLSLDLPTVDVSALPGLRAGKQAEGYELVPLAAVADRPEELYALDAGAVADVPATYAEDDVRLEDWLVEALGHPQLSHEASSVVLAAAEPVAYAFVHLDPAARMGWNEMTGTHRAHRRRGLARLAKLGTIAWAREHGYESLRTHCDEGNAGMLHLNRSLGYRPAGTETQYLLEELR